MAKRILRSRTRRHRSPGHGVSSSPPRHRDRDPGTQPTRGGAVMIQLATRIPKPLYRELKLRAVTSSTSISDLVTRYVADGLKRRAHDFPTLAAS
jgi:hypothetical protein